MDVLRLPIGWGAAREPWTERILGWLLTIFAVSLGAPFWFDVLNKFIVIRSTVKPREKSPEEGSEDRPSPRSAAAVPTAPAPAPPVPQAAGLPLVVTFEPHEWSSGDPGEGKL
jgi:hypothetical protein